MFVVSAGRLSAVHRPVMAALPSTVRIADHLYQSYETIWRTQPNVRTVVAFLARNVAQLGLHVFRRVSDTDRQRLTDHPLAQLLDRPLPPEYKVSRYRLLNALVHDLGIYDNAYWVKLRAEADTSGLLRIPPPMIRPIGDNWLRPSGYELLGTRGKIEIPAEQIVHFAGYNPDDPRVGVSPLETLRRILAEE